MCGRRGEGRTSGFASDICWIRAYVKAEQLDYLDQLDQQKCKPKANCGNYMLNALPVLDDSVSM